MTIITQRKISETWKKLPEHESRHLLAEEAKKRRLDLRKAEKEVRQQLQARTINKRCNTTTSMAGKA